jgi:hypothetical protein
MLQPIPHDVILNIIREADALSHENHSMVQWTSNASLISHAWRVPCQAWLFSRFTLEHDKSLSIVRSPSPNTDDEDEDEDNLPSLVESLERRSLDRLRFLESKPDLAAMVTSLRLSNPMTPCVSEESLAFLFPNVTDLVISSGDGGMITFALDSPMTYTSTFPLQFPLLQKLDMHGAGADFVQPAPFTLMNLALSGTNTFIRGFLQKVCGPEALPVHTIREVKLVFGWEEPTKEVVPPCLESVSHLRALEVLDLRCEGNLILDKVPGMFPSIDFRKTQ